VGLESPSATLSRDGAWWIYRTTNLVADLGNIMAIQAGSDSEPIALVETPYQEAQATLSPDGQWFAYSSERSGRREVYVRPFPEADGEFQISNGGGSSPVWGHLGRELFYLDGSDMLVAATYTASPGFSIESQETLFDASDYSMGTRGTPAGYDVTRDDQRFVMIREDDAPDAGVELILVQNLFEELKQRTGGN
jgi:serine/threonine-protein kinase